MNSAPYYHEIKEALDQKGCPFCRLQTESVDRYLDGVLWEMVTDPKLRGEVNESRGYCNRHAWMLMRAGGALGHRHHHAGCVACPAA